MLAVGCTAGITAEGEQALQRACVHRFVRGLVPRGFVGTRASDPGTCQGRIGLGAWMR